MYYYQVFTHPLFKLSGRILIVNELRSYACILYIPHFKNCHILPMNNNQSLFNVSYKFWNSGVVLFLNNIVNKIFWLF